MEDKFVLITEDEGVVKTVHRAGSGDLPQPKNIVHVHYELFIDDKLLDSSLERGEPLPVTIGEGSVIRGWELALSTMQLNEKATVICKPEYGYGALGSPPHVPANATLRFEMEIVKIERPPTTVEEFVPIANAIKDEGNKLYTEKKYAEAFAKYEKALDVFRHMFPKEDSDRAKVNAVKSICLSNQAACKIQEQDWKLAKVCCESALDLDEKAVKAIYRRGQCLVGLGEFERGLEDYKRALELDPKNAIVPKLIEEAKKKQQNYNKKSKAMYSKMFASEDKEK